MEMFCDDVIKGDIDPFIFRYTKKTKEKLYKYFVTHKFKKEPYLLKALLVYLELFPMPNKEKTFVELLKCSSNDENKYANFYYGTFLLTGKNVKSDVKKAYKFLKKAYELGYHEHTEFLGIAAFYDDNYDEAFPFLSQGVVKEKDDSNMKEYELALNSTSSSSPAILIEQTLNLFIAPKVEIFNTLSNVETEMNYLLAYCYYYGKGTSTNIKRAKELYEKVQNDWPAAKINLAKIYLFGKKDEIDLFKACQLLNQLIKNEDKDTVLYNEALFLLSYCARYGAGMEQSFKEATRYLNEINDDYYQPTAELELIRALYSFCGIGSRVSEKKAYEIFEKIGSESNPIPYLYSAICVYEGFGCQRDIEEANQIFKSLLKNEGQESSYIKAICYNKGYGVDKNPDKAIELFKIAAERGKIEAYIELCFCYINKGNYNEAVQYNDIYMMYRPKDALIFLVRLMMKMKVKNIVELYLFTDYIEKVDVFSDLQKYADNRLIRAYDKMKTSFSEGTYANEIILLRSMTIKQNNIYSIENQKLDQLIENEKKEAEQRELKKREELKQELYLQKCLEIRKKITVEEAKTLFFELIKVKNLSDKDIERLYADVIFYLMPFSNYSFTSSDDCCLLGGNSLEEYYDLLKRKGYKFPLFHSIDERVSFLCALKKREENERPKFKSDQQNIQAMIESRKLIISKELRKEASALIVSILASVFLLIISIILFSISEVGEGLITMALLVFPIVIGIKIIATKNNHKAYNPKVTDLVSRKKVEISQLERHLKDTKNKILENYTLIVLIDDFLKIFKEWGK